MVITSGALELIEMLRFLDAVCAVGVSESAAVTVKLNVPVAVGVPEIVQFTLLPQPTELSDNPGGRLPAVTCHE